MTFSYDVVLLAADRSLKAESAWPRIMQGMPRNIDIPAARDFFLRCSVSAAEIFLWSPSQLGRRMVQGMPSGIG